MDNYKDLLKYPVIGLTIFLFLLASNYLLDLEISRITKIGPEGIELMEQKEETDKTFLSIDEKLNEIGAKVVLLESKLKEQHILTDEEIYKAQSEAQTVSDQVARFVKYQPLSAEQNRAELTGFIMIGSKPVSDDKWDRTSIVSLNGLSYTNTQKPYLAGEIYKTTKNLVLRDGLPPDNDEYFRARAKIGLIQASTDIQILNEPEPINRDYAIEYWAKVKTIK